MFNETSCRTVKLSNCQTIWYAISKAFYGITEVKNSFRVKLLFGWNIRQFPDWFGVVKLIDLEIRWRHAQPHIKSLVWSLSASVKQPEIRKWWIILFTRNFTDRICEKRNWDSLQDKHNKAVDFLSRVKTSWLWNFLSQNYHS